MKKVLSVLLAAAMVMGMSVTSMAAGVVIGSSTSGTVAGVEVDTLGFNVNTTIGNYYVKRGVEFIRVDMDTNKYDHDNNNATAPITFTFEPGDVAYFAIVNKADGSQYNGVIDESWYVNASGNGYISAVSFVDQDHLDAVKTNATVIPAANLANTENKFVKVSIVADYDEVTSTTFKLYMYMADDDSSRQSDSLTAVLSFANAVEKYVDFKFINDADRAAKWIVKEGDKGTAWFNIEDGSVYYKVKMISEEEVVINLSQKYDIDIDEAYNEYDAELDFYNFKGSNDTFIKEGEVFIPSSKDNKFIYEVVDDELVAVEAEYVTDYKIANAGAKVKGYTFETDTLGYYVVADEELVVAEVEVEVEAPAETDKANPETGANDFVGAAVALAVVSVAAAGALALKK